MSLAAETASETLQLRQHYQQSTGQVFAAWADPAALSQWFGPHSHRCSVEKYDFKEGGVYQIRMIPVADDTDCGGDPEQDSVCAGEFVQIIPNEKIVMTFSWIENGADIGETLLTIELNDVNGETDLLLTHERLPSNEIADMHKSGWAGSLECLQEYFDANK